MSTASVSIIVFAYNEAENIGPVLGELRQWIEAQGLDAEVVFVDDGSRDETSAAAQRALAGMRAKFLRHDTNRGIGAALKTGVPVCDAPWVTFLPADGQIEPEAVGTLLGAAADQHVDVVFSVYDHRDDGAYRTLLSWSVRALIHAVHGVRMRCDGPYLFRRELFVPAELPSDTFFLNFEFPIRILARGLRTRTVTIKCRPRLAGVSKSASLRRIVGVAHDLVDLRIRRFQEQLGGKRGS